MESHFGTSARRDHLVKEISLVDQIGHGEKKGCARNGVSCISALRRKSEISKIVVSVKIMI